nr:ABC transporter permease [uncultured Acetatifactor sp.]
MLKSMGMTGREFRRMIWLEGVFYGGKSLFIGIPFGILLSVCFHQAFGRGIVTGGFHFPWTGTAVSVGAVIVLLYVIMHYSMGKINRKNIIETIQNENI